MILAPLQLFFTGVSCYLPLAFGPPVPLLLSLSTPSPTPKFCCFFFLFFFSQFVYKLHNSWKEHKCNSLFFSLHMEPPKFKVHGYLSFLLYLHIRVELFVKLYLYMSVFICQFSNIVYRVDPGKYGRNLHIDFSRTIVLCVPASQHRVPVFRFILCLL